MNYQRVHDAIVSFAKQRIKPDGYCERHHIQPKSMGGADSSDNTVWLTAREHYLIHWLLFKIHRNREMAFAWYRMTSIRSKVERYTSHTFEYARIARARAMSSLFKGKKHSAELKKKFSEAKKGLSYKDMGRGASPLLGRALTDEHKARVSAAGKGRKHSEATRLRLSKTTTGEGNSQYGKTPSEATRQKLSRAMQEAALSRSNALLVEIDGVVKTASAWSREPFCSVKAATVISRINKGWPSDAAVYLPILSTKKHTREELKEITQTYRKKLKELQG